MKRLLQMGSGSGILIAAVILLGRGWLPQLFSPDPDVIAAAARALPIVAASMVGSFPTLLATRRPQCRFCGILTAQHCQVSPQQVSTGSGALRRTVRGG